MRPRRSFIMCRTHALHRRYTAVRLVAITASQSSGFMRRSSVSRVMAALLTRIEGSSPALLSCAISASIEAGSAASSTAPRPLYPCDASASVSRAAPSGLVAVPMTRACAAAKASAMALPMPREAPVMRATWFSSMGRGSRGAQRRFDGRWILDREETHIGPSLDAPIQRGQHLARTTLDYLCNTSPDERTQRIRPAHWARDLSHEHLGNIRGLEVRTGVHRAHVRYGGGAHGERRELRAQ